MPGRALQPAAEFGPGAGRRTLPWPFLAFADAGPSDNRPRAGGPPDAKPWASPAGWADTPEDDDEGWSFGASVAASAAVLSACQFVAWLAGKGVGH